MTDKLKQFLRDIDIELDEHFHSSRDSLSPPDDHAPYTEAGGNIIAPLSHYGFLKISGPESSLFLQGQTSCDVDAVSNTLSATGSCSNPKGRLFNNFVLARSDDGSYLMRMRRELIDHSHATLGKYIVFSKAEHSDASDDYLAVGLAGPLAAPTIEKIFKAAPTSMYGTVHENQKFAVQLDDEGLLFECWLPLDQIKDLWPSLSAGFTLSSSRSWELINIRLGRADVCIETVESFIAQMLNYHLTGTVSFTKGCYTGQEVIARMQYKGRVKRRLYRVEVATKTVKAGDKIYTDDSNQSIGNIVNCYQIDEHTSEALAVISAKHVDGLRVLKIESRDQDSSGAVTLLSLP